jgi:hypothetical protein
MTKDEFLNALATEHQIKFEGSTLQAPTFHAGDLLHHALTTLLPKDTLVRFAVQTSTAADSTWDGQLEWFLALRSHLVKVTLTARGAEEGGDAKALIIASNIYPVDSALRVETMIECPPGQRGTPPGGIVARISLGSESFEVRSVRPLLTDKGVAAFIAAVLEAGSRK